MPSVPLDKDILADPTQEPSDLGAGLELDKHGEQEQPLDGEYPLSDRGHMHTDWRLRYGDLGAIVVEFEEAPKGRTLGSPLANSGQGGAIPWHRVAVALPLPVDSLWQERGG